MVLQVMFDHLWFFPRCFWQGCLIHSHFNGDITSTFAHLTWVGSPQTTLTKQVGGTGTMKSENSGRCQVPEFPFISSSCISDVDDSYPPTEGSLNDSYQTNEGFLK